MMKIKPITDPAFALYGKLVVGYDPTPLLAALRANTPRPVGQTVYVAGDAALEALHISEELSTRFYGGMPIQVGYCNGENHKLNCLEYHRNSEVNLAADEVVLLVAPLQKIKDGKLDTAEVEAFLLPAGVMVQLYETTLHYAPCTAPGQEGFRVAIVLPRNTNTERPTILEQSDEDRLLWARNKWLIAHPDSNEAKQGAFVGLVGENLTVE